VPPPGERPPDRVDFGLEEALSLLAALEDARMFLSTPTISPFCPKLSIRSRSSAINLAWTKEVPMSTELLRASEAARRLEMSTKELLRLIYGREIRYQMVDGIAHVPSDALEEYRARAS
jgi:hypothetical protein